MATFDSYSIAPLRIALLAGGEYEEREISLQSGAAVNRVLCDRGHAVTTIDPAECQLQHVAWNDFDVAFIALHGRFGEDGEVQSLLQEAGVAFTGSDADTSRLAFSKSASKERFAQCNVPTPSYTLIHESDHHSRIEQQAGQIGYPLVVKPDAQGSSLGVSIVEMQEDLPQALERCFQYDAFGILERAIIGTEWTVGLLDDQPLPLVHIETDRSFFDYKAKYDDDETHYHLSFSLPTNVVKSIENAGRQAGRALGTRGLARVDIRVDELNRPWVLEANTIPGMTDHSLIPKASAKIGIDLGELCERAMLCCLQTSERPYNLP